MNIGSLSNNWLLYQTMIDLSRTGEDIPSDSTALKSQSFETLLKQVLLQTEMRQNRTSYSDLLTQLLSVLPLESEPSLAGIPSILNGTSLTAASADGQSLDNHLGGVLQNTGQIFQEAGERYQIKPALLAAISMHETGNGTSNAARFKFNVAGMMGKNGLKSYASIRESIFDMARNLRENYLDKGKTTIAQIGAKYAPIGANNDPNQLNNHWVRGVQQFFDTLTKGTGTA